jgi:hypothetical protein
MFQNWMNTYNKIVFGNEGFLKDNNQDKDKEEKQSED